MTNITKWILEETHISTGHQFTREYLDYTEALDAFTEAEADPDKMVSLSKKTMKLLTED